MWRRHAVISVITMAASISTILLMTGVLFFTNDVLIMTDDYDEPKKFFTMKENAEDILAEFGYEKEEHDRVVHGKNEDGRNSIEIVKGFGVEIIADGNKTIATAIPGETYSEILEEYDIEVGEFDAVITGEKTIRVVRGFGVDVKADGKSVKVRALEARAATVDDILQSADITVGKGDVINMPFNETVTEGDEVIVGRVTYNVRTYKEEIPYETSVEFSNLLEIGDTEITEGINGEYSVRLREKMIDGEVVTSEVLHEGVVKEAQTKVITHGTALKVPYSKRDFPEIRLEN
ncbi:MAG: ubiquitin-like domain-containing protein, partial [Oscillospiraceae bacterium]|nr:ubiquitin-like domain-containing protein [Oscillospiraceae bacterium]